MSRSSNDIEGFYSYAMELFASTGHATTSVPEFVNHTSKQFVFFDGKTDLFLSKGERHILQLFDNVSRLFSFNGCTFFSMNLLTVRSDRSQVAHDIHTMIHPSVGSTASVCLFKWEDEVLLSFVGYGLKCVLSGWFSINDDAGELFDRLHIGNMSVDRGYDYFIDMVYTLARSYYFLPKDQSIYELIPINMVSLQLNEELDRDDINSIVEQERTKPQREYGYDYVEYDDSPVQSANLDSELDSLLLEISDTDFEEDNPFGEEVETEDDDDFDEDYDSDEHDEYEFENLDPELFRDPTLMVKWLQKENS